MSILALDQNYQPHRWITVQEAIILESKRLVIDRLGSEEFIFRGGINRVTGMISTITTNSIIVLNGEIKKKKYTTPSLTNIALFQRDRYLCAYCARRFKFHELTRDHIIPTSKSGKDTWTNVVAACKSCNSIKGDSLPGSKLRGGLIGPQGNYKLDPIFLPYTPCLAESLIMKNRSIKADQMSWLLEQIVNKQSRMFDYNVDSLREV